MIINIIGSIPVNANPTGVQQFLVIDGQQRLTTLLILLSAVRDKVKYDELDELSVEINETMLVNRFKKGEEYFKLLPYPRYHFTCKTCMNKIYYLNI